MDAKSIQAQWAVFKNAPIPVVVLSLLLAGGVWWLKSHLGESELAGFHAQLGAKDTESMEAAPPNVPDPG